MARQRNRFRPVHGVLLLDKPAGMTSNAALQAARRIFRAAKAGHTGSLDPLATGLLPVCFGEATKISSWLLESDKGYDTVARLGQRSTTGDADGELSAPQPVPEFSDDEIEAVLARFRGEIKQIPPMYSAIRKDGRRLYELARQGEEVEREPRRVIIHELALLGREGNDLRLRVRCSKGTYIRTLVEDIGEALGCGAHVAALRRTEVAPFSAPRMWTLDELQALAEQGDEALLDALLPIDASLAHLPAVHLGEDAAYYLQQGQPVQAGRLPEAEGLRLYRGEDDFLGIGVVTDDLRAAPKRLVHCNRGIG